VEQHYHGVIKAGKEFTVVLLVENYTLKNKKKLKINSSVL
jgi:hypothetical protein